MPLVMNSWIELLAWFPTHLRLYDGLCGYMYSLVRFIRWLELGTIFSRSWAYEFASLPCQTSGQDLGSVYSSFFGELNQI